MKIRMMVPDNLTMFWAAGDFLNIHPSLWCASGTSAIGSPLLTIPHSNVGAIGSEGMDVGDEATGISVAGCLVNRKLASMGP